MMRILLIVAGLLLVSGCSSLGLGKDPETPSPIIEYREIKVPVPKTPMPPNTDCPTTELETITPAQSEDNELLVKAYRITVAQLRDCSKLRQRVLDKYREIAADDKEAIDDIPAAAANPNAPFGSSGPVVAPGSTPASSGPDAGVPGEELIRQMKIERAFGDLENEFENLDKKEYDIE